MTPETIETPRLLRDVAYAHLLRAIVTGQLAPGTIVRDAEIAAELGCSRAPVRDALLRLIDENLVEVKAKSYTQVSLVDVEHTRALVPVISVLRAEAARLAARHCTAAEIEELAVLNAKFGAAAATGGFDAVIELNQRFHGLYATASRNPVLAETLERLAPYLYRTLRLRFPEASVRLAPRAAEARAELVDALRRRAPKAAATASDANSAVLVEIIG